MVLPTWLHILLLAGGLTLLVGLQLRDPGFWEASLGPRNPDRVRRNWSFLIAALLVGFAMGPIAHALREVLPVLVVWDHHHVANAAGCFLVAELIGWGLHFAKHESRLLWKLHFQHHRETRYDIWLVTHTHGLEVLVSGSLMMAALIFLGFSPLSMQLYLIFYALANTYQHSSTDLSLGWLDRLIVSPAYHRFHHAVGAQANFGNTLTVWDVVFRTARWPVSARAPEVEIGIGAGPEPYGFLEEMTYVFKPEAPEPEPAGQAAPQL